MHAELAHAWHTLKQDNPNLRIRNAADHLGVSELDLLLTRLGDTVTWLDLDGRALAEHLPSLGRVMALVRNDSAVHETTGAFTALKGGNQVGLFLGTQDQRLFFNHWAYLVAVSEGARQSLQVFDASGGAVIKLYRQPGTDAETWQRLIGEHRVELTEAPALTPAPPYRRHALAGSADGFRAEWRALTDVHQFHDLLERHRIDRLTAFEVAGDDLALRVAPGAVERAIATCADTGIPLMTFVGNRGAIQIHTGVPGRFLRTGPWFNILDPDFNLHLNTDSIASAWVSRRPTVDGWVTSLEAFDRDGRSVVQFFGERKEGRAERDDWRGLMDSLAAREAIAV